MKRTLLPVVLAALACGAVATARMALPTSALGPAEPGPVPIAGGDLPPGPNFAVYKAHCLSCHTSSYVIQQEKTTRAFWEASVKKMVDLYDAPITEANQKLIIDYLVAVRGLPESPAAGK
ncbi:hypothetical protein AYO41_05420 [Verrucomicrobia bacterium SCGC AG-212-E04]|nr:hypothetical protein AYO41_05420 [Verrucomicrobia bacterium SCGC AG-212-E04]